MSQFVKTPDWVWQIRKQFPVLNQTVHGKPLVYFDNGATSLKPQIVIDQMMAYYQSYTANIHRGVHFLSEQASLQYEQVREKVAKWIGVENINEIIFTKGSTESFNLLAFCLGEGKLIQKDDEIVVSYLEHHANIVPWQMLCERVGARLIVVPITSQGTIDEKVFLDKINAKTKIVSLTHASNALGNIVPIQRLFTLAKQKTEQKVICIADGAQALAHLKVNLQELNADFYTFSGHKLMAPTGVGVLWGKYSLLEKLPPYQGGGDMIQSVSFEKTTYNPPPFKFEAGTPPIAAVIGLGSAIDFIQSLNHKQIEEHENQLTDYAESLLSKIKGLKIIAATRKEVKKLSVISFVLEGIHPHDIGTFLDQQGIAVRTGHHCAQPLMGFYKLAATARASLSFYNTFEEIDHLVSSIQKMREFFL